MQFGMLYGAGFALTYAVLGLVCGALADRFNRRWLIFAGVSIWSLATAALGVAQNFWQLPVARLSGPSAVGFGMSVVIAVVGPLAALLLLAGLRAMRDAMTEAERAQANAIADPA